MLLNYPNVNINLSELAGMTPAMKCFENKKYEFLFKLIDRSDFDPNVTSIDDKTLLLQVASSRYSKIITNKYNDISKLDYYSTTGEFQSFAEFPSCFNTNVNMSNIMSSIDGSINYPFADNKNNLIEDAIIYKLLDHPNLLIKEDKFGRSLFTYIVDNLDVSCFDQLCLSIRFKVESKHIQYVEKSLNTENVKPVQMTAKTINTSDDDTFEMIQQDIYNQSTARSSVNNMGTRMVPSRDIRAMPEMSKTLLSKPMVSKWSSPIIESVAEFESPLKTGTLQYFLNKLKSMLKGQ